MSDADQAHLKARLQGPFEEFADNFYRQHNREFDWLKGAHDPRFLEALRDVAQEHLDRALTTSRR